MKNTLPLFVAFLIIAAAPAPPVRADCTRNGSAVPVGHAILMDGRLDASEWDDACEMVFSPDYRMLIKQDQSYLYVAVIRSTPAAFGVNLYLAAIDSDRAYLNLHASAKLGERTGRRGAWPDWEWWNNRSWSANVGRFNAFTGQRFLPDTIKEIQIALERLPGTRFRITFDAETIDGVAEPVTTGPTWDGFHWMELQSRSSGSGAARGR